ncbi:hypothetical protein [Hallella multisaccharivorax]|uniref:hypothetical protein n=1 Tax=Hallella multisaccharivorax TaxID=310514 RepID=UPI00031D1A29|nr:hypothetical protein [Hallella multisaccharivorax]
MQKSDHRIILCLAHMSGNEMKYIQEAFDQNWVKEYRALKISVKADMFILIRRV